MTQQISTAFSSFVQASATFAGIPYGCAEGDVAKVFTECTKVPEQISTDTLLKIAKNLEYKKLIDPLSGVSKQKVFFKSQILNINSIISNFSTPDLQIQQFSPGSTKKQKNQLKNLELPHQITTK